jgi:hypothetical protein
MNRDAKRQEDLFPAEAERLRVDGLRRKQEAGKQHGAEGGRGHKKTLTPNSESAFKRDRTVSNANSSAGRIAVKGGVSRYKAEQALKILRTDPGWYYVTKLQLTVLSC